MKAGVNRLVSLFLAIVFVISVMMTGTYSWQSANQQAQNEKTGASGTYAVELHKLEKLPDGTLTETPVPGAVFYLYTADGEQIGGRYVSDSEGRIQVQLPQGDYYFEEVDPGPNHTFDTENDQRKTRYPFTVEGGDTTEVTVVTAYNVPLEGPLTIRKLVRNVDGSPLTGAQEQEVFEFTVTFSDGGIYSYRIDGGEQQSVASGGTIYLKHGQAAVFENIPAGVLYNVTETPKDGYTTSGSGHRGNITEEGCVAAFVNTCDPSELPTGSLTVSKEVTGEGADLEKEFTFTAVIGGEEISFTLKHGESYTFPDLPVGTEYTITETEYTEDGYIASVRTYTGTITGEEELLLPFVNVYDDHPEEPDKPTGSLEITKEVVGENADPNKEFTFEVTFSDGGTYTYRIDGGEPQSIESGGTITLRGGQTAVIEGLPQGVTYTVREVDPAGYLPAIDAADGVIAGGETASVTFRNRVPEEEEPEEPEETGSLNVSKEVVGEGADPNKAFTFTAVIGGETYTFTLKHGESYTFPDLPVGTEYTITETEYTEEGYIASVKTYTGVINGEEELLLPFVNVYDDHPEEPDKPAGSLEIIKEVVGENPDPGKEFTFEVTFSDGGTYSYRINGGELQSIESGGTITLKGGQTAVIEGIPQGVIYTVREIDSAGYLPAMDSADGMIAGGETASVTFQNRVLDIPEEPGRLAVTKQLAGEYPEADKDKEFHFTLVVDGKKILFTLKPGETVEFELPPGADYEIREDDYFGDGYSQSIENSSGTVIVGLTRSTVTNTYVGPVMVEVSGEKTWDLAGYPESVMPDSILVRLMDGDRVVEEKTVTPDENGEWRYTFQAPKYDADGNLIQYTVEEVPLYNFMPSYDGYNIKNTYLPPVSMDPPILQKFVVGDPGAPSTRFEFLLRGENGAPMPEGSDGNTKILTLNGSGRLEIGEITFDRAGTFTYTITELNGGIQGWTYDPAVYTMTVTVTAEDGRLVPDYVLTRDGQTVGELVFTNDYERITPPDKTVVSGIKTWDYGDHPEEDHPDSIIVYVYADGELYAQRRVTAQDGWTYVFELPKYAEDGHEIVYTVGEASVRDYEMEVKGYNLVNTYTPGSNPDAPVSPGATQTGDNISPGLWIALAALSMTGLVCTGILGRRRGRHKEKQL